jgi:hypothetical protein
MTDTIIGEDNATTKTVVSSLNVDMKLIRIGAILVGVGGSLGFAGLVVGGSAVLAATRQWANQLEQPPTELAKQNWQRVLAASSAGAAAWKQRPPAGSGDPATST